MTATNMCSNFGGKWDSPPASGGTGELRSESDLSNSRGIYRE